VHIRQRMGDTLVAVGTVAHAQAAADTGAEKVIFRQRAANLYRCISSNFFPESANSRDSVCSVNFVHQCNRGKSLIIL